MPRGHAPKCVEIAASVAHKKGKPKEIPRPFSRECDAQLRYLCMWNCS